MTSKTSAVGQQQGRNFKCSFPPVREGGQPACLLSPQSGSAMPGKKRSWQKSQQAEPAGHGKLLPLREGFAIPIRGTGSPKLRDGPAGLSQAREGGGPRPYARGSSAEALAYIADPSLCSSTLKKDISAATTTGPNESRRQLWADLATKAGYSDPFHLRPDMVYEVMGALKLAGFRSAQLYLDTAKAQHVSLGYAWSDQLRQCYRAAVRSCLRNIGSPKQASPLPLAELAALGGSEAVVNGGPIWPARAALLASWWLLREIEASHAVREHVEVDEGNRRISWRLPSSKTDWKALGATRCHSCSCEFAPPVRCPYHCMVAHLEAVGQRPGAPFSRQQTGAPHPKLVGPTPSSGWAQLLGYQSPTPTAPGASPGTPPGLQGQFTWQPAKWKCGASSSLEDGALKCSSSMSRKHH